MEFRKHLISKEESVKIALTKLNALGADAILFLVDEEDLLIGSLTDGDIRRGLIKGFGFETPITEFIQPNPVYIIQNKYSIAELESYKKRNIKVIPILNEKHQIIDVLNFRLKITLLPVDTVIMAGGRGERLKPLTDTCPKPMLKVGDKPIIQHNVDRLRNYGIGRIVISIRYLGDQIRNHFDAMGFPDTRIEYIEEVEPLGTFGGLSLVEEFNSEHILLMNSDLLTNIDFADFYNSYLEADADLMIASIPYNVKIPYAVLQIDQGNVISFDEKPTYSYYSNGGIYLFKKSLLKHLEKGAFFNATDFMELLISLNKKVAHYPILGYWLDIGRHEDFEKAQSDISHIKF